MKYISIAGDAGRYPFLDGLRALAILLVLFRHSVQSWPEAMNDWGWNLFYNSWLGVDIFFVLSGFLISFHLLEKWPREFDRSFFFSYFKKRSLRILPLYIIILIIASSGVIPFFNILQPVSMANLSVHVLFLQDYIQEATLLVPLWSLAVEEKFYLVAPVLIYALTCWKLKRGLLLLLALIVSLVLWRITEVDSFTLNIYPIYFWELRAPFHFSVIGILFGVVIAVGFKIGGLAAIPCGAWRVLVYFCWLCIFCILVYSKWLETYDWMGATYASLLVSGCASMLILGCLYLVPEGGLLASRFLRHIAKLAYPLYLCHMLVIPLSLSLTSRYISFGASLDFLCFLVVYLSLSWLFSVTLHLLIEKPFLILKDRV